MATRTLTFRQARLVVIGALLTIVVAAALGVAAIVMGVPNIAVPAILLVSVGGPLFTAWELPAALRALVTRRRARAREIAAWRATLAELPETKHPLGF